MWKSIKPKQSEISAMYYVLFLFLRHINILHNGRVGFKRAIILIKIAQESVHPSAPLELISV